MNYNTNPKDSLGHPWGALGLKCPNRAVLRWPEVGVFFLPPPSIIRCRTFQEGVAFHKKLSAADPTLNGLRAEDCLQRRAFPEAEATSSLKED